MDSDIVDLLDHARARLLHRMEGLSDAEWVWRPIGADDRVTVRWRLEHIAECLTAPRTWVWLGSTETPPAADEPDSAAAALAATAKAYLHFRALITAGGVALETPVGAAAGRHHHATRRSFVLHVADELIHHAAEAALIRDLYAARSTTRTRGAPGS